MNITKFKDLPAEAKRWFGRYVHSRPYTAEEWREDKAAFEYGYQAGLTASQPGSSEDGAGSSLTWPDGEDFDYTP